MNISIFLLLLALKCAVGVHKVTPDLEDLEGLVCYQCQSSSKDVPPKCDSQYFKYNKHDDMLDMTFQCPHDRSSFCIKKVEFYDDYTYTWRACTNSTDDTDTEVRPGCIWSAVQSITSVVCICSDNKCNKSPISFDKSAWRSLNFVFSLLITGGAYFTDRAYRLN